jgi:hypothetical protein
VLLCQCFRQCLRQCLLASRPYDGSQLGDDGHVASVATISNADSADCEAFYSPLRQSPARGRWSCGISCYYQQCRQRRLRGSSSRPYDGSQLGDDQPRQRTASTPTTATPTTATHTTATHTTAAPIAAATHTNSYIFKE